MALALYTAFYYLISPFIVLRLLLRSIKAPAYRQRIAERFGFFSSPELEGCIWMHTVSMGETIAAVPLVKQLQQRYPGKAIVMTTMTPTGSERVKALLGDSVFHVYAPYDLPCCLQRFLRRLKPSLLVIMETELWPNTLAACQRRGIATVLVNARLSQKSAAGYQRFAALSKPMLQNLSLVAAQTEADAARFVALGMAADKVAVTGSIKFDISIEPALQQQAQQLKAQCSQQGQRLVWIAASTHKGEDEIMLAAHRQLLAECPDALLILVPRHPERFNAVAQLVQAQGFSSLRRSSGELPNASVQVYVGDTMGEMMLLLGAADIAFVGGSLVASGGHNMLEPAAWGLPVLTGPSDFNFLAISQALMQAQALTKIEHAEGLAAELLRLQQPSERLCQGQAAQQMLAANQGALARLLALLAKFIA
ncbi:lipid IV(A) 3-deoxy-D-manno-octulosonic acid transferase [Dasania sp. GY-MA-18]|uniref:3-deoxy-D-manno-octulosonic acid transferase n=1 Tax=Dasania phycosphaerae TaxID=2950436 RepID=A0A9J6RKF3_9GAMM|nr:MULTISPECIES: lipid IV(A) 3-deoxy-D-manno-octulosonic acid transferase [Dasania]MCR8922456.1 lipid IV(A) 3-deoxy-D-manno-octulosonic acid transferase [Dasania sp. GY-MA-18]MCZ0864884.1 lipid IV(A) 3-deoxy-D-manno-octulosonic acid transferase [Dasania phycosphaerae]MCZ0868612.1 lipid IV(A) 3-deoxy-D-manno-octulosonic acid transferase [Dasania phycosphaerae]